MVFQIPRPDSSSNGSNCLHAIDAAVSAARTGNQEAFAALVSHFHPLVFRTALKMLRNVEDAEDTAQDSFLRAFLHLGSFRGDSRFSTWLTRITINTSLMRLRNRKTRTALSLDELQADNRSEVAFLVSHAPSPEELCSHAERKDLLDRALTRLPFELGRSLLLQLKQDLSIAELAGYLGTSEPATKSRLLRGRLALKESIHRTSADTALRTSLRQTSARPPSI